jgi:hypothetical protein
MTDDERGALVIRRLHRLVRHGYRPWLGYDVASGLDGEIELRRKDGIATLRADGSVLLSGPERVIAADDSAAFDNAFAPNTRNRRNLVRRLYEIGIGAW